MTQPFRRTGALRDLRSYPLWLQSVVARTEQQKKRVVEHELFTLMRDARLPRAAMRKFLAGAWPTIEQFPQVMAMNLRKLMVGNSPGEDLARQYLIRNIRVEQNHADHWVEWAIASGVSREDLLDGNVPLETHALSHWCWHTCERDALAAAMAATNYSIEGVTGDWSGLVCSQDTYENTFEADVRAKAMKWLKLHAKYDDTHPWEALEIICAIMGTNPSTRGAALIRSHVLKSYEYMRLTLDYCISTRQQAGNRPGAALSLVYPQEKMRA